MRALLTNSLPDCGKVDQVVIDTTLRVEVASREDLDKSKAAVVNHIKSLVQEGSREKSVTIMTLTSFDERYTPDFKFRLSDCCHCFFDFSHYHATVLHTGVMLTSDSISSGTGFR